ncbi:NARROW LEAF 1-like protein, partial [Drosera capensis]
DNHSYSSILTSLNSRGNKRMDRTILNGVRGSFPTQMMNQRLILKRAALAMIICLQKGRIIFANLQKGVLPEMLGRFPKGQRATTLLELMTIRAFHSKILHCYSLGTAVGFRIRRGVLTDIPAILVFVSRKVHKQWLSPIQCLPTAPEDGLDPVRRPYCFTVRKSQDTYGTLGAILRSQTGNRRLGFLTNRHVAVDLDYPSQKMYHPLPPTLGPGVYLGAVERATSFITDDLWYDIFAGINPDVSSILIYNNGLFCSMLHLACLDWVQRHVRADGAFIPFADGFDLSTITTGVKGIGEIGQVKKEDLQSQVSTLIGKKVMKVGRSSGLTTGTVLAYALEYNDEKGKCFLTDFLVVGENPQTFDLEGGSGSLITQPPKNWTSGVDLGRLLNLLELDLINDNERLGAAIQERRAASGTEAIPAAGDSPPPVEDREGFGSLGLQIQHLPVENGHIGPDINAPAVEAESDADDDRINAGPSIEHQFMCSSGADPPPMLQKELLEGKSSENLSPLRHGRHEDICVPLQLGDNEPKRRRSNAASSSERPIRVIVDLYCLFLVQTLPINVTRIALLVAPMKHPLFLCITGK